MERWIGKVAVVTGASSGIGAAIAVDLTKSGLIVIGLAPILEQFEDVKKRAEGAKGQFHAYLCDVTIEESVHNAFDWIEETFGHVNILVNNAGIYLKKRILDDDTTTEDLLRVINTNSVGPLHCIRAAYKILKKTGEPGHIVNICSISGHYVPYRLPPLDTNNVYAGTKHFIKATTEVLRQELINCGAQVRVSMISPGSVKTGIFEAAGYKPNERLPLAHLQPEDVSAACLFILGTPPHVQIHDLIIRPVGELF